ncbi:MAG: YaiI/YqxD family protein [Candidatus Dactylopiibacterium sp.]|nr:YaiI/YqxD family protein [Candidatus Dactylopiibacterium sp.]
MQHDTPKPAERPRLWVDADACPVVVKEILFRAAARKQLETVLVANRLLQVPPSPFIRAVQVAAGFDAADHYIAAQMHAGDLVVTADVPLAAQVIERGGLALNPRGELYSAANVRESLALRDFMEALRSAGVQTGGPAAFSQADRQAFANQLDRLLARIA